jgi:hypothetical protein
MGQKSQKFLLTGKKKPKISPYPKIAFPIIYKIPSEFTRQKVPGPNGPADWAEIGHADGEFGGPYRKTSIGPMGPLLRVAVITSAKIAKSTFWTESWGRRANRAWRSTIGFWPVGWRNFWAHAQPAGTKPRGVSMGKTETRKSTQAHAKTKMSLRAGWIGARLVPLES